MIGVGQDVSTYTNQNRELRQTAHDLEQVIEYANAPIFGTDAEGLVNEWNRKAASLTGYSKDEVFGHNLVEEFINEEYRPKVKEMLGKALAVCAPH